MKSGPAIAVQRVVAVAAADTIRPLAGVHAVGAATGSHEVGAGEGVDRVVAGATENHVALWSSGQHVRAAVSDHDCGHRAARGHEHCGHGGDQAGQKPVATLRHGGILLGRWVPL